MPFTIDEPKITDFTKAYSDGITGEKDRFADTRTGSMLDNIGGPCAILWNRETVRDTDLFKNIFFSSAEDSDLTNIGFQRYKIPRILDSQGTGYALLFRSSLSGGAGTFPTGTQLSVIDINGAVSSRLYYISADTAVAATANAIQVPIKAVDVGSQTSINTAGTSLFVRIEDPLWDNSWTVQSLKCQGGTDFEPADQYRARVKSTLATSRKGYVPFVVQTCINAGAANVVTFASNYAGNDVDFGINALYVGDTGFNGTIDLQNACEVALEAARVLGADLSVRLLVSTTVDFNVNVYLYDDPNKFDTGLIQDVLTAALVGEFSGSTAGFSYSLDGLRGTLMAASNLVQFAEFTTPSVDAPVMVTPNIIPTFPATLSKYKVGTVVMNFLGPI